MSTFAERLRYAMGSAQMSQAELSRRSGVSKPSLSMYLAGQHEPTYETLTRLATATGVPIDFLRFGDIPEAIPEPMRGMKKMGVRDAALCLQKSEQFVRIGLQQGRLPIGAAVRGAGGRWSYYISAYRLRTFVGAEAFDRCFAMGGG